MKEFQKQRTLESYLNLFNNNKVKMYPGQRTDKVWDSSEKEKLAYSILNSFYVPPIIVAVNQDGEDEILDGQQRLTALNNYKSGEFGIPFPFSISGRKVKPLRHVYYSDLTDSEKFKFNNHNLTLVYLDGTDEEKKYQFEILNPNTGMNEAERRNIQYDSQLIQFVRQLVKSNPILSRINTKDGRMFRQDMIERLILMIDSNLDKSMTPKNLKENVLKYKTLPTGFRGKVNDFFDELALHLNDVSKFKKQNLLTLASVLIHLKQKGGTVSSHNLFADMMIAEKYLIANNNQYAQNSLQGGYGKSILQMRAEKLTEQLEQMGSVKLPVSV